MYTGAQVIIQAGQDLPARWGAAITCVNTQCPATLQDHRYLQLHFTWWWGGLSTHETAKIQPHIHPRISRLVLAPTRGNPRAHSFRPHTPQASLYITPDIKTKQGKSAWTGGPHIQLASPCACTCHRVIETKLFGTNVKSDLLLQSQCCISRCHEHKAFSHCLQMPESCTVFLLPSKYKIIIKK